MLALLDLLASKFRNVFKSFPSFTIQKQIKSRVVICWFFFEVENFEFSMSDHNNNTLKNGRRSKGKLLNI